MTTNKEFDEKVLAVIPSLFLTFSSAGEDEESEESYKIGKVFANLPSKAEYGTSGSVCTSAFLQHEYIHQGKGSKKVVKALKDMRRMLQEKKFYQTLQLSSSRPIDSETVLQVVPKGTKTKRALLIGIRYSGSLQLRSSHADCLRVRDMLISVHQFPEENITILMDDNIHTDPTKRNIENGFLHLARESQPGDINFISFSGHGGRIQDREGDEESGFDSK